MTNTEIIQAIKAEVKRIASRAMNEEGQDLCEYLLSFLDTLEEKSEKPTNGSSEKPNNHPVVMYHLAEYMAEEKPKEEPKPPVPLKDRYTPEERYQILLTLAEKVWGKKLSRFKTTDDTRIRMFVSYMMWMEGYSYEKIGKVMGRNHSSCINHVRRMRNVFDEPVFYAEENEKYELFDQYVRDHDGEREN